MSIDEEEKESDYFDRIIDILRKTSSDTVTLIGTTLVPLLSGLF